MGGGRERERERERRWGKICIPRAETCTNDSMLFEMFVAQHHHVFVIDKLLPNKYTEILVLIYNWDEYIRTIINKTHIFFGPTLN